MSGGSIRRVAWRPAGKPKRSSTTRAFAGALVSVAGLGFCPGAATAADLSLPRAPVAPVASAPAAIYSWTGFYIGGQVRAGGSRSSWSDPVTGGNNIFAGDAAFLGGGAFGPDYLSNALVLGVMAISTGPE